ncbi:hypothetical protein AB0368_13935 [Actinoplanes sp. NPDC051475]|uniref:hypothetical protein n=1 Tax=Actinoplanes sp. NPDC051475 TaxID=3157225 RepID=UPI00344EEA09
MLEAIDEDSRQPSLLPGWTRGHVLTPRRPRRRGAAPGPALRAAVPEPGDPRRGDRGRLPRSAAKILADINASAEAAHCAGLELPEPLRTQRAGRLVGEGRAG